MKGPLAAQDGNVGGGPVDLSATPPFRLGGLQVQPATREVTGDDGRARIAEPWVLLVLAALSQAAGAVASRDLLVRRCWDGRIVGEDAINRAIAKARQLAELTDPPAFAIETVPRVGYRLVEAGAAAPAPVAAAATASARGRIGRRGLALGAAALLAAGAAGYAGLRWWPRRGSAEPLVAVLPFDSLSPDPQMGYFADGLSEDILNALIGGGMRVTSRSSSFTFRGPAKAKAAGALNADYLLDGSVLRDGARLRVNAHLTDVKRQQTLWSETYDRDVGQGLQIEDEIAARVTGALELQFIRAAAATRNIDPVAYDLYLRGREATRTHTPESQLQGEQLLRQAVAIAPHFADAWLELAQNAFRHGFLEPIPDQQRGFAFGREAARKVIELDPRRGSPYGVIANLTPHFGRWLEVDRLLGRGLALTPNDPDLILWRGIFLAKVGRLTLALEAFQRAQALDPLEIFANHNLFQTQYRLRRFPEAEATLARLAAIWPTQLATYWGSFWLRFTQGRYADAAGLLQDVSRRPPDNTDEFDILIRAAQALGQGGAAERRASARELVDLAKLGTGYAQNSMVILARMGEADTAVELARAIYLRKGSIPVDHAVQFIGSSRYPPFGEAEPEMLYDSALADLRRAGRLNEVFDGIGLTAFWRATGPPTL